MQVTTVWHVSEFYAPIYIESKINPSQGDIGIHLYELMNEVQLLTANSIWLIGLTMKTGFAI